MKTIAADSISKKCQKKLAKICEFSDLSALPKEELPAKLSDCEVLIVRSKTKVTKELVDSAPKLKAVIRGGVGLDNIDANYCKSKNIQVLNTPQSPSMAVAELAVSLMLSMLRQVPKADASTKSGQWLKKELEGRELTKKTVGIVGFGRIGFEVGRMLKKAFKCKVLVADPFAKPELVKKAGGKIIELEALLPKADIITLHVPLLDSTRGIINAERLSKMKNGVLLVNTSRGAIIDEQALCNALSSGKVGMAALDVFWNAEDTPFNSCIMQHKDKLVLTPHIGGSTREAQDRIGEEIVEIVKKLAG